jgi:hypothetical protein
MTPERMAALVAWWVRRYTRNLPPAIAERRIGEIDADLHDQIAHERAQGTGDRRTALSVAARMVRGMPADASWRRRTLARSSTRKEAMKHDKTAQRSALRVGLVTALILLVPGVGMLFSDEVDWGVADFVFAAALLGLSGALLELAVRKSENIAVRVAAAALGVAAIVLGEADDAPGLVLFGGLLVIGTIALTVRTALRSG